MPLKLESPAFADGDAVPRRFTGDGRNVSPALAWSGVPPAARELALIVEDPDAPGRRPWVHWLLYKIPADAAGLPEGVPRGATPAKPAGMLQGRNSWGRLGYGGPAPPKGHSVHHYHFTLFVLDRALDVFHSLTKEQLWRAMSGHVIDQAELVGTYGRSA